MKSYLKLSKLVLLGVFISAIIGYPLQLNAQSISHKTVEATGGFRDKDWAAIIDSTWGPGLPTADKLAIFDAYWDAVDEQYACFQNLTVNWDSLRTVFRPEIEAGVSRGRFAGIMDHLVLHLYAGHHKAGSNEVHIGDIRGLPLMVVDPYRGLLHFGAGLTPLPDSTTIVTEAMPDHPLGLVPGDIVLGYEGIPWKNLYKELLNAQLPYWGSLRSSEEANIHAVLASAGMNWHLFETIDILKYATGDTLHFSTALLDTTLEGVSRRREQLQIPGVPLPVSGNYISHGIIEGTNVGYIYIFYLHGDGTQFRGAVSAIMFDNQTDGLIIDMRRCQGGYAGYHNGGMELLFNTTEYTFAMDERADPNDHFAMQPSNNAFRTAEQWKVDGHPQTYYDKPIAVLTGPGNKFRGEHVALQLKFHPMVRFFGKSTSTTLNTYTTIDLANPEWTELFVHDANIYLVNNPGQYLTHVGFEIDEEVWLTQEDVAQGKDTVVETAIDWINNLCYAHDVTVNLPYAQPGVDTVGVNAVVQNLNSHNLTVTALFKSTEGVVVDSTSLFDDGNHSDGIQGDGTYGGFWPVTSDESNYFVDVRTVDNDSASSHLQKNSVRFTTRGPLKVDSFTFTTPDTIPNHGETVIFKFDLRNDGVTDTVHNVMVELEIMDTSATFINAPFLSFGDLAPNAIVRSSGIFVMKIVRHSPNIYTIPIKANISSDNYFPLWTDTFWVTAYPTGVYDIEENTVPTTFALSANFPNPFNPKTTINYQLPRATNINITVYNLLGEKITTLIDEHQQAGYFDVLWNGKDSFNINVPSGVYLYKMEAGDFVQANKMILIR